jgi:hypothetical protein
MSEPPSFVSPVRMPASAAATTPAAGECAQSPLPSHVYMLLCTPHVEPPPRLTHPRRPRHPRHPRYPCHPPTHRAYAVPVPGGGVDDTSERRCFFTIVGSDYAASMGDSLVRLFVHILKVPSRSLLGSSSVYFIRVARRVRSALLSSSEDRKLNHLSVAHVRSRIGPETAEIQPFCRSLLYQLVCVMLRCCNVRYVWVMGFTTHEIFSSRSWVTNYYVYTRCAVGLHPRQEAEGHGGGG